MANTGLESRPYDAFFAAVPVTGNCRECGHLGRLGGQVNASTCRYEGVFGHVVAVSAAPWRPVEPYWPMLVMLNRIARNAKSFLAHYLPDAYGYGSEELLRALRIAIRP